MGRTCLLMGVIGVLGLAASMANADPTAGSLVVPPEAIGPKTLTYDGSSTSTRVYEYFSWPNYLTGMYAGTPWRMEVSGIDVTGVTGPTGRSIYFQLVSITPDGSGWWYWHSLNMAIRLDVWGDNLDKDLFQCQETYDRTGLWDVMRSAGFNAGGLTRDDFDLRMDFYKADEADPWTVTPSYRLHGGDWALFDGGAVTTTNSWLYGAPPGEIWPGQGGTVLDVHFSHGATGTLSFDNITITPEPATITMGLLGLSTLGGMVLRKRKQTAG